MTRMIFTYRDNPAWDGQAGTPKLLAGIDLTPLGVAATIDELPIVVQVLD